MPGTGLIIHHGNVFLLWSGNLLSAAVACGEQNGFLESPWVACINDTSAGSREWLQTSHDVNA